MRTALITGATSGIGEATAKLLAKEGYRLIVCGRRQDRLKVLQQSLQKQTAVQTLNFDLRKIDEVRSALNSLPEDFKSIDILINNAGNAHGLAPIHEGDVDDWDAMLDINVKGLLYMTRLLSPAMVSRGKGHIINVGSIAGKDTYINGNVYCASKFAVNAISDAMRKDLVSHGVKVSEVRPGLVETEFSQVRFKGDDERAKKVYQGYDPLVADDIAECILFMLSRPDHVTVADMTVLPKAQASSTVVHKNI